MDVNLWWRESIWIFWSSDFVKKDLPFRQRLVIE
jgi:hypothetical protein